MVCELLAWCARAPVTRPPPLVLLRSQRTAVACGTCPPPGHTAWMSHPCCSYDVAVASTPYVWVAGRDQRSRECARSAGASGLRAGLAVGWLWAAMSGRAAWIACEVAD